MRLLKETSTTVTKAEKGYILRTVIANYALKEGDVEPKTLVGKRVEHETFGVGTVEAVIGADDSAELRIAFDKVGVKTLVQSVASNKMTTL